MCINIYLGVRTAVVGDGQGGKLRSHMPSGVMRIKTKQTKQQQQNE